MEIKRNHAHSVEFRLTGEELRGMRLSYARLDHRSPATQALLSSLLRIARRTTDFQPGDRLTAEFFPDPEGDGCTARLYTPPKRWRMRPGPREPSIYAFEDINTLIAGAKELFARSAHRIRKSDLYRLPEGWRLALYPCGAADTVWLGEYASRCARGGLAAALLGEHTPPLLNGNALDLLVSYFG